MAMSAEAATMGRTLSQRLRQAAVSLRRAMRSSTARKGRMSWVAINKAMAATAIARSATQTMEARLRFHASP